MIACFGWGSLVWAPDKLPLHGKWRLDGPELGVEFARISRDGRLTLVLIKNSPEVKVCWAEMAVSSLADARSALAQREGIPKGNIERDIGYWDRSMPADETTQRIEVWANRVPVSGVVWTALPPKFRDEARAPSEQEAIHYLSGLAGDTRAAAERYVRRAPRQIATPYRRAIERILGWTPLAEDSEA